MAEAWQRVEELGPALRKAGRDWDELETFLKLRRELMELDTRFAQLGTGLFADLDRRPGVLRHQVRGVADVELAVTHPPLIGRARLRGEVIRREALARRGFLCDWSGVMNPRERAVLDLRDPFESEERWRQAASWRATTPEEGARSSDENQPSAEDRRLEESLARLRENEEGLPPEVARRRIAALRHYLLTRSLARNRPSGEPSPQSDQAG
jgi:hypothetical protein